MSENNIYNFKYTKILSDSQAAIQASDKVEIKSRTVLDTLNIWEDIAVLTQRCSLGWIKAHNGLTGNELADDQAKIGTKLQKNQVLYKTQVIPRLKKK